MINHFPDAEGSPTSIQDAIEQFVGYVRATQTLGTANTYLTGLRHFARYLDDADCPAANTPVGTINLPMVSGYLPWLYDYLLEETADGDPELVSDSTKATYLAAISRFLEYLIVETQIIPMTMQDYDKWRRELARATKYTARTELPPDKLPSHQIVHDLQQEARRPLGLADDAPEGERRRRTLSRLRNIAILEAMATSGMRVSEVARLRRGDLLYEEHGALLRHTKGKKQREVLFSDDAWRAIWAYLQARHDGSQARPLSTLPVFARHDKKAGREVLPMSTRSIQQLFQRLAERAGILERFHLTPHTLRHYFATEFLSNSGSLALTQYALGHASPATTRIYAQTKRQDYRRAHRGMFGGAEDDDSGAETADLPTTS